jgi:hypothetical protein
MHWTHDLSAAYRRGQEVVMGASESRSTDVLRHGAYVCLTVPEEARRAAAEAEVPALAAGLGLVDEFGAEGGHPQEAVAFLRRLGATAGDVDDPLLRSDVVVHVASASAGPVARFCAEIQERLPPGTTVHVLRGVGRPTLYTGGAMHEFAYAHQVLQQSGRAMPHAVLLPLRKTAEWWAKDWMERHTYFLPRHDEAGRRVSEGHALAAAAGIPCLMRRTYRHEVEPAPAGAYDFLTYFECAESDVATFEAVHAALRDVRRNPEWAFVREGPTWHGRRVASWHELFA